MNIKLLSVGIALLCMAQFAQASDDDLDGMGERQNAWGGSQSSLDQEGGENSEYVLEGLAQKIETFTPTVEARN